MSDSDRKEMTYMSTIIGIAGTNFCTFVADQRLVSYNQSGPAVLKDDFQKIFQINRRVLFGVTGLLNPNEDVMEPLKCYDQWDTLSIKVVYRAVMDYMKKHKASLPDLRNYLIGGKDNKGHFLIYEVHWNPKTQKAETTIRKPQPPKFNFAVSCCLPPAMEPEKQEVLAEIARNITTGDQHHKAMTKRMQDMIRLVSAKDLTVSPNSMVSNVF